ncbi:hypothetical protein C6W10_21245 [Plantactinospora sp. BB1]|nr:hypothetical protein C6W10_21245 [Plantactinospora sp. BB1]
MFPASAEHSRYDVVLSLELTRRGTLALLKVIGRVEMENAHLLVELVDCLTADRPTRLVVDLSGTTLLSAHGLTALLQVQRAVAAAGGLLALRNPSPATRYALGVSGVLHQFEVQDHPVRHCPEPMVRPEKVAGRKPHLPTSRKYEPPSVASGTV